MISMIIKACVLVWTFISSNKNYAMIKTALDIGQEIAKHTKTDIDNAALASMAAFIRNRTKGMTDREKTALANHITKKKSGALSDVRIGFDSKKGLKLDTAFGDIKYNHNDGSFEWGKTLKF